MPDLTKTHTTVSRDGEKFSITFKGVTLALNKDEATFIGSSLMGYLAQLAEELGPPLLPPNPESSSLAKLDGDDFMMGK